MSVLRIYLDGHWRDSATPCPWALCDEMGTVLQSGNDALAALPHGHDCVVIVAAECVLLTSTKLPPGSRQRWHSALAFVAEEHTLPDPEDNHVVPGAQANGLVPLAVVDKPWFRRFVTACLGAKLSLRRAVPETLLPPFTGEDWTLVWDGNSGFVRTGAASGMALDNGDDSAAPLALRLILNSAQTSAPQKIEVRLPPHAAQQTLPRWGDLPLTLTAGATWDWRCAPIPADALNLLWGEFSPRTKIRELWPQLRPAVVILLLALGVEAVGANIEWAMLANEKRSLLQDMERSFHSTFGDASMVVNAPLQMQRKLAELRHAAGVADDGDFLPLLDLAAAPLAALPAGSVHALHYEAGRLDADVKLARKDDIQNLRQQLQHKGLSVRIGDIHDAGNGAEARLTLLPGDGQ